MSTVYSITDLNDETRLVGTISPAPGGSQPGVAIVRGPFSFAFNTPNLNNGVAFYTPTVGDILLDAWIEVDTAFDGTTPHADIGTFGGGNDGLIGLSYGTPWVLSNADTTDDPGLLWNINGTVSTNHGDLISLNPNAIASSNLERIVPAKFATAAPLLLVVSQSGAKGGTAIGGTAGAGKIYIVTATPVAFS